MADEGFAQQAAAAAMEATAGDESRSGGAPPDGGTEPADTSPLAEMARELSAAGVAPEKAREMIQTLALLKTPEGQQRFAEGFLVNTEQGRALQQRFGSEYLATMLAAPNGGAAVVGLLKQYGVNIPEQASEDDADLSPEARDIKAMRRQQQALEEQIRRTQSESKKEIDGLRGRLQTQEQERSRRDEFAAWARTVPAMNDKAYVAIAQRAHELVALDPQRFGGNFRTAISEAQSQLQSVGQLFAPKPRPRTGLMQSAGGIPTKGQGGKELSLAEQIRLASREIAQAARFGSAED